MKQTFEQEEKNTTHGRINEGRRRRERTMRARVRER